MEIILAIIVLVLVCIMAVFSYVLRELKEKYDELFITSQQLVDAVKDIDNDVSGRRFCYYANLINSSQLGDLDGSLIYAVKDLKYAVAKLKEADNDKKELEMIAERKKRMADYIAAYRNVSSLDLADALYDIANGGVVKEEE